MGKDKVAIAAGGGSRAAKKRRKQKATPAAPTSAESIGLPDDSSTTGAANGKGKGKVSRAPEKGDRLNDNADSHRDGKAVGSRVDSQQRNGAATGGGGGGASRRSQGPSSTEQTAAPMIIDASDVDDRSRLLLELDAHGVVSDPEVESGLKARQLLQWMVAPLTVEEFYESYWEKNAVVVRGRDSEYFGGWLETADIESFVSGQSMQYGTDLDVTNYVNKRRITLNPKAASGSSLDGVHKTGGRKRPAGGEGNRTDNKDSIPAARGTVVTAKFVWEKFREGCSLRMPCPQKFSDPLHRLLASLEEEFGCMVGSNAYLTPPRSQGFAPHWDDIEAFLLQVEGRKRWRVYRPADERAMLPRLSSPNLTDEQAGEPVLEVVLEPGDLLYFPRGWIHQAETIGDEPSLHITVSAMQGNCWADLVEGLIPQAVASAVESNQELREGLPRDYLEYMGVVHSDETEEDRRREGFRKRIKKHLGVVVEEALQLLDAASDQMGKRYAGKCMLRCVNIHHVVITGYISDRLPPVLEETEEAVSVMERGEAPLTPLTRLRMARRGCARLILEDGVAVVYHCMDNSRVHHGNALSPLEFELDDAPAVEVLLAAYPDPVKIADLPHPPTEDLEDKVGIATALYKEGFLLVVEDDDSDEGNASLHVGHTRVARAGAGAEEMDEEAEVEEGF